MMDFHVTGSFVFHAQLALIRPFHYAQDHVEQNRRQIGCTREDLILEG